MSEDDIIILDNHKLYVAKYWTSDDLLAMVDLLNQEVEVKS